MIINNFFEKNNTIIKDSDVNTGKNPVMEMYYGGIDKKFTRYIFKIDLSNIISLYNKGHFNNIKTVKHTLKMFNTSFFDYRINGNTFQGKNRAQSFKLKLYKLNEDFAEGNGYSFPINGFSFGDRLPSSEPSNFYKATNMQVWKTKGAIINNDNDNIFSITIDESYMDSICNSNPLSNKTIDEKYFITNDSDLIAEQTFYNGGENLSMDITSYITAVLEGTVRDYGLCLCFTNELENTQLDEPNYVGFFGKYTNTIYSPVLQTIEYDTIKDDRLNFKLNKTNRLYYYGDETNEVPTVSIYTDPDDEESKILEYSECDSKHLVHKVSDGIYYIDVKLPSGGDFNNCSTLYDVWEFYNEGDSYQEELSFSVTQPKQRGLPTNNGDQVLLLGSGLTKGIDLNLGDIRDFYITPNIKYKYNELAKDISLEYIIYAKEGNIMIPMSEFLPMNQLYDGRFQTKVIANSFNPNTYYIDIRMHKGNEEYTFKEFTYFNVVSERGYLINMNPQIGLR